MVRLILPGERHWEILSVLLSEGLVTGPLVIDAALAALAIENGASICTIDRDFAQFQDLRIVDPSCE